MKNTDIKKSPVKRVLRAVLGVLLALIIVVAGTLTFFSFKNNKIIYETVGDALGLVSDRYDITELDPGEFTTMRMYGIMKFRVKQYDVAGLGNLSVMTANMGMMQMVSFMITPMGREVPLCTLDFMYILGNRKSYVEFYDLVPEKDSETYRDVLQKLGALKEQYADVEELPVSEAWYDSLLSVVMHKQLSSREEERNKALFLDSLSTYLDASKALEMLSDEDTAAQIALTKEYSDGLIANGGVSTDVFKKSLGEEKTREFFDRVFFGTANYQ